MTYLFLFLMLLPIIFSTFRHLLHRDPSRTEGCVYGFASGGLLVFFVLSLADVVETTEGIQGVSILLCFAYAAICMASLMTADGR